MRGDGLHERRIDGCAIRGIRAEHDVVANRIDQARQPVGVGEHGIDRAVIKQIALRPSRNRQAVADISFRQLIGFASLFEDSDNAVVELGLTIASYTYGALLGVFLLGIIVKRSEQSDALVAFALTLVAMVFVVFGVWHGPDEGWIFMLNPSAAEIVERDLQSIAWPWYPVIGSAITVSAGAATSGTTHTVSLVFL